MKAKARRKPKRDRGLVSRIMRAVRSADTGPELALRRALRRLGRSFKYQPKGIPGHPDFVFEPERVAVFVDGDFWHGRQWKTRGHASLAGQFRGVRNSPYWIRKIERNMRRDALATRRLRRLGFKVVRLWETDLRKNPDRCIRRVKAAVGLQ
jgi:DNA mismatch endonuclease (patch repair protein)